MTRRRRVCVAVVALLAAPAVAQDGEPANAALAPPPVTFVFGDGVRVRAGALRARVRTRLHLDLTEPQLGHVLGGDDDASAEPFDDARGLRRARWLADLRFTDASFLAPLRVRAQTDFARSDLRWLDLYGTLDLGTGPGPFAEHALRGGQFREPFGFEAMTSVTYLPFLERSTASNAFTPGRNRGLAWILRGEGHGVDVGWFRTSEGEPFPDALGTGSATTLRAFVQPEGGWLDQVGASVTHRSPGADGLRFDARPGTRTLERVVDTGTLEADSATVLGFEAFTQRGATAAWVEAFGASVDRPGADATLTGGHVAVSHFLTEGAVDWRRSDGELGAPNVPDAWRARSHGSGAVEAVVRAGWVDLEDGEVHGGRVLDVEAGLNWYLMPATRVMLHGLWLGTDGGAEGHALLARLLVQL